MVCIFCYVFYFIVVFLIGYTYLWRLLVLNHIFCIFNIENDANIFLIVIVIQPADANVWEDLVLKYKMDPRLRFVSASDCSADIINFCVNYYPCRIT